ncbi:MAG TPA: hypothetical protein VGG72_11260 [Bryobacteraceae bacterium]|jgi:hypothetical protein
MSAQKPPRLADWLLFFFGYARQNPPLAGDILEEFQNGKSATWYWRQTFVLVLTCMGQNARDARPHLTAAVIGWALQAGVALLLWPLRFPPRLPHGKSVSIGVSLSSAALTMIVIFALAVVWQKGLRELKRRSPDPERLFISGYNQFGASFLVYCLMTMMGVAYQWGFLYSQALLFSYWIMFDLIPAAVFARRKKT